MRSTSARKRDVRKPASHSCAISELRVADGAIPRLLRRSLTGSVSRRAADGQPELHDAAGWRESASLGDSIIGLLASNRDVRLAGHDPLAHYLDHGRLERRTGGVSARGTGEAPALRWCGCRCERPKGTPGTPTILCLSHVMHGRPGRNDTDLRSCWLRDQGATGSCR